MTMAELTSVPITPAASLQTASIGELAHHLGETVALNGWFVSARPTKAIRFIVVRDRTGTVQAVCRGEDLLHVIDSLTPESAIRVTGIVRETSTARFGKYEIAVEDLIVIARADSPLPVVSKPDSDARLDFRFLDLRSREQLLIFEIQTALEAAMREFLLSQAFIEIHTPKITGGGSETGAAVFELSYFGAPACLVQSPQFYMQLAMAAGFDRAFEVGPVFRAEPGITNRHATEFTCLDIEVSWIESHHQLMDLEDALLRHALDRLSTIYGSDIERYYGVNVELPDGPIPRIPLSFARELIRSSEAETGGARLTYQDEQVLSKYALEHYGHSFVFVTDYPAHERPFYTMRETNEREVAASRSFDLFWRGLEITSGCQREHRYDRLYQQICESGIAPAVRERYLDKCYLEMFKYGCPPHGGLGIGINRLLMVLLGQQSIRDTSFVFRGPGRYMP